MTRLPLILALLASVAAPLAAPAAAQTNTAPPATMDQIQRADGVQVVPEKFLRRWDPVTVFFDHDAGPRDGGAEDDPAKFATLSPDQAGAWQWLGPRVLQFRPAEPWEPLRRVTVTSAGHATTLVPLLPTPVATSPADQPDGIADLDTIGLTFADPVDVQALARLLTIELRPLPGFDGQGSQQLTSQDFTIKALERADRTAQQGYVVTLRQPIPDGRMAILRLRLSDAAGLDDPIFELRLRSAAPFTVTDASCGRSFQQDLQDGVLHCSQPTPYEGEEAQPTGERRLRLRFSNEPEALDVVRARDVLRITPAVDDLALEPDGRDLTLTGRFLPDMVYTLRIDPGSLKDVRGRPLSGPATNARFVFPPDLPALAWDAGQGISERFGPQMVPLRGHGYDRADIRIHRIDPLGRDFWPFPAEGLTTQDDTTPPLAGNEPSPWKDAAAIDRDAMAERIAALGSPAVSELVPLPSLRGGVSAKFGLDLKPLLAKIAGASQPGTYMVGLRPVDGADRRWLRLQVTDLTLSTVEEPQRIRFAVTSLNSAKPVDGAEIRLEGVRDDQFVTLARGVTGADGGFTWAPKGAYADEPEIRRIVVTKGTDTLVLEPENGPAQYAQENWTKPDESWLAWGFGDVAARRERPQMLCHVFTERPIYRPEEAVEIRGFVRSYLGGALSFANGKGEVVVNGPDDQEWRMPVTLDGNGGFYQRFDETTEATGDYSVRFVDPDGDECGQVPFKKEAYKLPTFEVLLNGPDSAPLDSQIQVSLLARYFAGGLLADRPIKWRVTQFPYSWTPPGREGFQFSSDSRFSGEHEFRSTPVLQQDGKTDAGGSAQITLDPTIEPTAQPRRYVVEATVTGDDDMQIRSTQHVVALPPFTLGLKVPRYLPKADAVDPEILAVDAAGKPLPGVEMTVKLIHRNWNSVLQASDFSQGSAKYVTQVIDETIEERKVTSTADVQALHFALPEAGVYIVSVEAADKIGRSQSVKVDLFAAGDTPVTWSRPPGQNVTVTADKDAYAPGETATLVIESPFQTARALAIVEEPEGQFRYDWVDIANGFGRYAVPVRKAQMPRLPVHFLIMRGRLPGDGQAATAPFDQGKPVTLATTAWVKVTPVENQVAVTLDAPPSARPAQEIEVTLHLADLKGKPLAGEATFWMVDQAVLSLAKEQPLDPLPKFIVARMSQMAARDTRNMAFGVIPLEEVPGGDEATDEWGVENISVRRNFNPVPIYLPHVQVGPDGIAKVKVKLPDTLTVYKIRAVVTSGPDRFGFGTGEVKVRQPIVAQPALPRFVRPGDSFDAGLVGRVVEGPGGSGRAGISVDGLTVQGSKDRAFAWDGNRPARISFPVSVPDPAPGQDTAKLRLLLQRDADKAGDAVEIALPIRPDRPPLRERRIVELAPGAKQDLLAAPGDVRPGSYSASVALAADPALVRLVAGLNALADYPFGCTEQVMALSSSELALKPYAPVLAAAGLQDRISADVQKAIQSIIRTTDEDGLVGFWPKSRGSVLLTAAAYGFLVRAEQAGETVDPALKDRLAQVLKQALRSDYPRFLTGEDIRERVAALSALAAGGATDPAYLAELSRRASLLPLESLAQVTAVVAAEPDADPTRVAGLLDQVKAGVRMLSRDGRTVYAGLQDRPANPMVLPSETRTLSEVLLAVAKAAPEDPVAGVLRTGLIGLGDGSGWGSTNADAAALRALAAAWVAPSGSVPVAAALPGGDKTGTLGPDAPVLRWGIDQAGPVGVSNQGGQPVVALGDARWLPKAPGSEATPVQDGFVLTRQLYRVPADGPLERLDPGGDGAIHIAAGEVVEEVAELVNPEARTQVALRLPIAAGFEPLNPNLATAPAEAVPSAAPSVPPSYASYGDDEVRVFYDRLDKGTLTLRFRMRAQVAGSFIQPPGEAEMMYRAGVYGASAGARIVVSP
ncbi:alpha-2-macroglobulin [Inquilinus limosus]|uniref:Alpha-2-macroglobulin n=1 Tax=Inquilinus limosus TaxID=171674 RepID=A0A211ZFA1_9PROT|nr:MG2 domain-containing protein [Inquilinus limosus]OWJ63787.1 alpha-2-macroglobulin [Inquilinus limosus]